MLREVYLDYNATTPCDPRVVRAMLPYFTELSANPSSAHGPGRRAKDAMEKAREQVAALIGATANEIIFTSGATESINLAIRGFVERQCHKIKRRRIVITPLEHKAVLETCARMERQGFEIVKLPVDAAGRVLIDAAAEAIDENTFLVSIQASNNEIGTLQPIAQLVDICHRTGAVFHCDAAQSLGKVEVSVAEWGVDLMSFSSHKMYGPKGVGALFVRGGARRSVLAPMFDGGGQEHGLRPGTLNTPAIVGFGQASRISVAELRQENGRIEELRNRLEGNIVSISSSIRVNVSVNERLPNTSSILFSGIDADALLASASKIAFSLGSACSSSAIGPSHVLKAIGMSDSEAYSTVRFSLGRFTSEAEVDFASAEIASAVEKLDRRETFSDLS
jgi:cysteine desulfurase